MLGKRDGLGDIHGGKRKVIEKAVARLKRTRQREEYQVVRTDCTKRSNSIWACLLGAHRSRSARIC
jgi:hypothetical protein